MQDINKLPVWARQRIQKLESDLTDYRQKLAQIEGKEDTDIFMGLMHPRPLPKGENIIFHIKDRYLMVRIEGDHIILSGSGVINIEPRAANSAWVRFSYD